MALKRKHDWQEKLQLVVEFFIDQPFAWGVHDCALFACNAAAEMTGTDLAVDFRGKYISREEAFRALYDFCGSASLEKTAEFIAERHGMAEVGVRYAQRGDIVLLDMDGAGPALGVVGLSGTHAWAATEKGLTSVPVENCRRAWRV
jgi:hypothetical protein